MDLLSAATYETHFKQHITLNYTYYVPLLKHRIMGAMLLRLFAEKQNVMTVYWYCKYMKPG